MAPRSGKRKHDAAGGGATVCDETRILDPYALQLPACRLTDHHRKKSKSVTAVRNCAENPNCLFGLGEHHEGVWAKPKLVQRLLGDDPREQLRAAYPSRKNSASSPAVAATENEQRLLPCGLRNLGATCYLNSMLQTLFTNVAFRAAVYEWEPKQSSGATDELALQMQALQKLFGLMQLGKRAVYDPNEFASTLSLNSVLQQDVQEFSKLLLTHLRMIFSQSRIADHWDLVDRIFQGHMSYVTTCLRCKTRSERPSSYYEISLNIKGHKTVQACLESYLSAEVLDGENKYFCDTCDSKERAERCIELNPKRLPQTITLQLMRFVYDAHEGRKKKLMDVIEVNETLNMTDLLRRCGLADAFSEANDAIYHLSGYLNHRGKSTHAGHYTASVAYPTPEDASSVDWFEFDDNVVNNMETIVDTEGSKERHGKILRSRDVYMLLYMRDDSGGSASSSLSSSTPATVTPPKDCLEEIATLNAVFESDVTTYVEKAEALEARIQARLDAYHRFFEKEQPSPKPDADDFYWVETSWLRSWIVGEEAHVHPPVLSMEASKKSDQMDQSASKGAVKESSDGDDEQPKKSALRDEDAALIIEITDSNGVATDSKTSVPTTTSHVVDAADIPFSKPIDFNRFCCVHSADVSTPRSSSTQQQHHHQRVGFKPASFAPENVSKLKRVSASLFEHLKDTCGIALNAQPRSPALEGRRSRRTSDQSDVGAVFSATSFRCRECEAEFCNRLLDDAELLRDVEHDLQLLKSPVSPDEPHPYLMSRAWIASYKTQLQNLRKKILHKSQTKKPKKIESSHSSADDKDHSLSHDTVASDTVLQNALNEDIACAHGNLTTTKKKYRSVAEATWLYFRNKFPRHFAFAERTVEACAQCQVDEAVSEEFFQVERACRDDVLSRGPLQRLYRRKAPESGGVFSVRDAFAPPGPVNAVTAAKKTMFVVPRSWMRTWREYIKNVEADAPPALTSADVMCAHHKLLLPQTLLSSLKGAQVDATSVPLEFVYPDEMLHLCELYGIPHHAYYYGVLQATDDDVVWKSCTMETINGAFERGDTDDNDTARANCSECEELSEIQHRDALENFEHCVVHVRLLADDQAVPTEERPVEVSAAGRQRRSKRIRSGGANWAIVANASDSVYVLKTKIYEDVDAYPIRQRLYFRGRVLEDRLSLKDCGVKAGDTVYMRLSEEIPDETSVDDDGFEREVGFEDSVFLRHTTGIDGGGSEFHAGGSGTTVWVCAACTYVNDEVDLACEMCTTERTIEID